jgi:hypothetical protein
MKSAPAPNVLGSAEAQHMSNALRAVLTVSKSELFKKETRVQCASEKKWAKKPS